MTKIDTAEIAEINSKWDMAEDPRDCYRLVREKIKRHESRGEIIPEDLRRLERSLLAECRAESQGR